MFWPSLLSLPRYIFKTAMVSVESVDDRNNHSVKWEHVQGIDPKKQQAQLTSSGSCVW